MQKIDVLSVKMKMLKWLLLVSLVVVSLDAAMLHARLMLERERCAILLKVINRMPRDLLLSTVSSLGRPIEPEIANELAKANGSGGESTYFSFGSHYVVIHEKDSRVIFEIEQLEFK